MKKNIIECAGLLISLLSFNQATAYIYSFSNHTNEPLKVYVQLLGVNEPWEEVYIPAKEMREFLWTVPGHSRKSLNIWKAGFCLQNIRVATPLKQRIRGVTDDGEYSGIGEELVKDAQGNVKFGPPANVVVKYVQSEGANAILRASESFADGLQDIAKTIAGAVSTRE